MSPTAPSLQGERPSVFVGSSLEGRPVAQLICDALQNQADPTPWWSDDIFQPTDFTLDALEQALDRFTHAVIVLSPDDITKSRGSEEISARDNAIFEAGLFVGRHGRRATLIAVPDSPPIRLPTDISGLILVQYDVIDKARALYDVSGAVKRILNFLRKSRESHAGRHPSPFWDVLGETVYILYGVEAERQSPNQHQRHRVSLRDLQTAVELTAFLNRQYPTKRVLLMPAPDAALEQTTQADGDVVVVGGFVTNAEFAQHRTRFERMFRLKKGRLCIVDGQRVHAPRFNVAPEQSPDVSDAQAMENFPTELTVRDYGLIFSGRLRLYGRERRVVAIAGVKGHGTRGAARYLCSERLVVDAQLDRPLRLDETVEGVVAVDVVRDTVDREEPIIIVRDGDRVMEGNEIYSVPCELAQPCEGCDFGLPKQHLHRSPDTQGLVTSRLKAVVFDLDDTLIDTFGTLITPLELAAAKAMIAAGSREKDHVTLASALLGIRRKAPAEMEQELRRSGVLSGRKALTARRRLLTSVSLDHLVLSPEVAHVLRTLKNHFDLYLLTSGSAAFQNKKIDILNIRDYFADIVIVPEGTQTVKGGALRTIAERRELRKDSILVVGNRLDQEIAAGNALGMPTVWVRSGEGSEMKPGNPEHEPTFAIDSVRQLLGLLWS